MDSSRTVKLRLVLFMLAAAFWCQATAQSGCTSVLVGLSPCLNYISGNSSTPSSSCCSQLSRVVQSQPQCLCAALNGGASSLGITINQTRALQLPGACNVQTPPVSRCNGSASAPGSSSPPADTSDATPAPTSGTGSKTTPAETSNTSAGRIPEIPIAFTILALLIASYISFASI